MDAEARIPAALETLGPVADRDVAVLAPDDGELTSQLLGLGGWVRALPDASPAAIGGHPGRTRRRGRRGLVGVPPRIARVG